MVSSKDLYIFAGMIQRTFMERATYVIVCSVSLLLIIRRGFDINVTTATSSPALSVTSVSNITIPGALVDTRGQVTNAAGLKYDSFSPHLYFSEECALIIDGSASQTTIQKAINVSNHQYLYSAQHLGMVSNYSSGCENYFAFHGYYNKWKPVNLFEEKFPVAFGMLIYHQVDQFEQLFRAIYRPNNFYCIHVDDSAKKVFKDAVSGIFSFAT